MIKHHLLAIYSLWSCFLNSVPFHGNNKHICYFQEIEFEKIDEVEFNKFDPAMVVSSKTHRHKVKITMQEEGKKLPFCQKEIEEMRREIREEGIVFN